MQKHVLLALCALVFSTFYVKASFNILNYDTNGVIQTQPGMYHYEVLHFGVQNTEGEDVKLQSITFEISGQNPQLLFSNIELHANNLQVGSIVSTLQNGTATFQLGSSVVIPAGQTQLFVVYADLQPGCNGGFYNVDATTATAFRMLSQSNMPVSGTGYETGSLLSISYTPTITLDGIPSSICPNTSFTPHATITWNSNSVCTNNLIYRWDFTWNATIQNATTLVAPTIQFMNSGNYSVELYVTDTVMHHTWYASNTVQVLQRPNGYIQTSNGQLNCLNDTVVLTASLQNATNFYWDYNGTPIGTTLTVNAIQAGGYTLHATNGNGCGDLVSMFNVTRDTFGVQLLWNGDNVDTALICPDQNFSLQQTLIGTQYNSLTYQWSDGSSLSWLNNATGTGEYGVTVTNYFGCSVADHITIVNREVTAPVITAHGPTQFCPGGSVLITATQGYQWYNWSPGAFTSLSRDSVLAMWDSEITLTAQDSFGCTSQSNTISVDAVDAPGTPTITQNGCELISNINGNNLQWYVNGGQILANTQVIVPEMSGLYSVMITNQYGCSATSQALPYQMPPLPIISVNGSTQLCNGENVLLTVQPGSNFLWSTGATTQSIAVTQAGIYTATVTNGTCVQTASPITITYCTLPSPIINSFFASPSRVCAGNSVNLYWSSVNGTTGSFVGDHTFGGGPFASNVSGTAVVTVFQTTTFTLTVSNADGVQATQSVTVFADTCTTTGTNDLAAEATIKLYPNPATTAITIENIPTGVETYTIASITGQTIREVKGLHDTTTTIDISDLAIGMYFLKFENGMIKKFTKQ